MDQVGDFERPPESTRDDTNRSFRAELEVFWQKRSALVWLVASLIAGLLTCLEQVRLIARLSRYVNGDHALLWLAARDWSRLEIREPTFYGQSYGVTFEAIPTALLHAVGVPYNVALQVALMSMALFAWWFLAFSAYRSGQKLASFLALSAPLLVTYQHWVVVTVIGTGVGRVLAALCAGLALRERHTRERVTWLVMLGGFGAAIDTASLLLSGPALLWAGLKWLRKPHLWLPACVGLILPLAWIALNVWFDTLHPDHHMHRAWSYEPLRWVFEIHLREPDRLLGAHGLELYPHGSLVALSFVALFLVALAVKAWPEAAAVGCALGQLLFLATLVKSLDERGTLWFPAARMTLCTPMALWFLLTITGRAVWKRLRTPLRLERHLTTLMAAATCSVLVLCASSTTVRAVAWKKRMRELISLGWDTQFLPMRRVDYMTALCDEAARVAKAAGTNIVAFPYEGTATYACPALHPGMLTVYPGYERRYWVLDELAFRPRERMIVWGSDGEFCTRGRYRNEFQLCQPTRSGSAVTLAFAPQPPLHVLHELGYDIRPFGPGCNPQALETCKLWEQQFRQPDSTW